MKCFIILFFLSLFCFALLAQPEVNSVVMQNIEPKPEKTIKEQVPNWISERFDILLGFALGLCGTTIIDFVRERRKAARFKNAASNELKQLLADLNNYALLQDSLINKDKALLWWNSLHEFELHEQVSPTEDNQEYKTMMESNKFPELVDQFVALHRVTKEQRERGIMQLRMRKLKTNFLLNNTETFACLKTKYISRIMNIIRRIDALNANIDMTNSFFDRSFDGSLSTENHRRIVVNYYRQCQFIADLSHIAAKEVVDLLRKYKIEANFLRMRRFLFMRKIKSIDKAQDISRG